MSVHNLGSFQKPQLYNDPCPYLTLCLQVSSADNLCKHFGPRSGPTKCRAWYGSNLFHTLMGLLKEFSEKKNWKKSADDKIACKKYPGCKASSTKYSLPFYYSLIERFSWYESSLLINPTQHAHKDKMDNFYGVPWSWVQCWKVHKYTHNELFVYWCSWKIKTASW